MKRSALLTLALAMLAIAAAPVLGQGPTSCETCHADADLFEAESLQMMEDFSGGAHAAAGLSCHDCHGGNPDPAGADDMMAAMDEGWGENPYVGTPERDAIPGFCGRCHSDPTYMRRFKPDARVDQEREYWTSHHGIALRDGDLNVATCVDCHGVHGILAAGNPDSLVYPTQVAETCRDCHGDPE
ncbi:MAG: cytochrome c3 family protein, partial [Thermoanaerobaculia bacterium]